MTLILSGTDGLSDIDGSASTPAIRGTDANTGIFFPAADTIAFAEGGAEVARFDSSGNLGIGTNAPINLLTVQTASTGTTAGSNVIARLQSNASGRDATLQFSDNVANSSTISMLSGATVFRQNGTESARIESGGSWIVGKTSGTFTTDGLFFNRATYQFDVTSINDAIRAYRKTATGGGGVILTYSDVGGTANLVGAGFANGTFGAVSDATKKKNIEPARSYLQDVMSLRVVKYNWITDEDNTPKELGWIAQEVEQVFPGMVSEQEGSKLLKKEVFLPMLMKCIQEQQQMIETLQAKVAALEAKG
jgi:hypothetical protein